LRINNAASISDLRELARGRLPRFAFDMLDGGAEDESNLRQNVEALESIKLIPRYFVDVSKLAAETEIFGRRYALPFGIAPVGMLNLFWPGTDLALARLAARENIMLGVSAAASTELEAVAEAAEGRAWFQLYVSGDSTLTDRLLARARSASYEVLLVTVDCPVPGKRDRDIRNGLQLPFRITPRIFGDLVTHPRWSLATRAAGKPVAANYKDVLASARSLAELQTTIISNTLMWDDLERLRGKWQGKLLVKGILHPEDARRCVQLGCDGLVISNHGGRQAGYGPASIEALPAIAEAVNGAVPLGIDSGVRRGADVIRAKALGADFALLGRAFGYGAGAGGTEGCQRAFDIVRMELLRALGQLGQPSFADVDRSLLATQDSGWF